MREIVYSNPAQVAERKTETMAKKKAKAEQPAEAPPEQAAEATPETTAVPSTLTTADDSAEADPEKAAVAESLDELRKQRDKYKTQFEQVLGWKKKLLVAQSKVASAEAAFETSDAARKKAKAAVDAAIAKELEIVAKFTSGDQLLPFEDADDEQAPNVVNSTATAATEAAPFIPGVDPAEAEPITVLLAKNMKKICGAEEFEAAKNRGEPIGMTEKQLDVLDGMGWDTIGKFEKAIRENAWWHKELKGFGPDKIDRLTITLAAFRRVYPMRAEMAAAAANAATPAASEKAPHEVAIDRLEALLQAANDRMNNGPADCIEFCESVTVEATSMLQNIREHQSVTDDQATAIDNWTKGVEAWQPAAA